MNRTNAICPQCGAQGTAGRFCEYCGTKIPEPVIENKHEDDNTPFSWYNVVPQGYEPVTDHIFGDYEQSFYMVVEKTDTRQYIETKTVLTDSFEENLEKMARGIPLREHQETVTRYEDTDTYAVINKQGKFVVDPTQSEIYLYVDNYDCIIEYDSLYNLLSKEKIEIESPGWRYPKNYDFLVNIKKDNDYYSIYERKNRTEISLDKMIPGDFSYKGIDENGLLIFEDEDEDEGRTKRCTVEINDNQGFVTFEEILDTDPMTYYRKKWKNELQNRPVENNQTTKKKNNDNNEGRGCCLLILAILAAIVFFVFWQCDGSNKDESQIDLYMQTVPEGILVANKSRYGGLKFYKEKQHKDEYVDSTESTTDPYSYKVNEVEEKTIEISSFRITNTPISVKEWDRMEVGVNATYDNVMQFITKLNEETGLCYELPTEMQMRLAYLNGVISIDGDIYLCADWYEPDYELFEHIQSKNPVGPSSGEYHVGLSRGWDELRRERSSGGGMVFPRSYCPFFLVLNK